MHFAYTHNKELNEELKIKIKRFFKHPRTGAKNRSEKHWIEEEEGNLYKQSVWF